MRVGVVCVWHVCVVVLHVGVVCVWHVCVAVLRIREGVLLLQGRLHVEVGCVLGVSSLHTEVGRLWLHRPLCTGKVCVVGVGVGVGVGDSSTPIPTPQSSSCQVNVATALALSRHTLVHTANVNVAMLRGHSFCNGPTATS